MELAFGDGSDGDVGDVGHAGEGLTAEAHGLDAVEVLKGGELGGSVSLAEDGEIVVSDAVAVVGDLDEFEAAILDDQVDGGGRRVQAVLHQLLNRRHRPLDHLAGSDSVHHRLAQPLDSRCLLHRRHNTDSFALFLHALCAQCYCLEREGI